MVVPTSVGIQAPNGNEGGHKATGTSTNTLQEQSMEEKKHNDGTKEMWANVVKRSMASKVPNVRNKGFVLSSFSRNNPVNRSGV